MSPESRLQRELRMSRPFESPEAETYLGILRTAGLLAQHVARVLRDEGLSEPQYNVLRIVAGAGKEGLPCQEIGVRMVTPVPDVTRLVDRLEKAGWAERQRSEDDRRVVRVVATPEGRKRVRGVGKILLAIHSAQLGPIRRKDLATIDRILADIREGLPPGTR